MKIDVKILWSFIVKFFLYCLGRKEKPPIDDRVEELRKELDELEAYIKFCRKKIKEAIKNKWPDRLNHYQQQLSAYKERRLRKSAEFGEAVYHSRRYGS